MGQRLGVLRLRSYGLTVGRAVLVVLGVLAVISALTLVAIGVLAVIHSHHHAPPSHVVTVTTTS